MDLQRVTDSLLQEFRARSAIEIAAECDRLADESARIDISRSRTTQFENALPFLTRQSNATLERLLEQTTGADSLLAVKHYKGGSAAWGSLGMFLSAVGGINARQSSLADLLTFRKPLEDHWGLPLERQILTSVADALHLRWGESLSTEAAARWGYEAVARIVSTTTVVSRLQGVIAAAAVTETYGDASIQYRKILHEQRSVTSQWANWLLARPRSPQSIADALIGSVARSKGIHPTDFPENDVREEFY